MKCFLPYVRSLEALVERPIPAYEEQEERISRCLDGEPARELRKAATVEALRSSGAFFTGSRLSTAVGNMVAISSSDVYFDPTCGAGDLLLAVARRLPLARSVAQTVVSWSEQLTGYETSRVFVRAAKARLVLLAMSRHGALDHPPSLDLTRTFQLIKVGDALRRQDLYRFATTVLMNPPFSSVLAPNGCSWAGGGVNGAALFTEAVLDRVPTGCSIIAILPDVLRSGDRYLLWRKMVDSSARLHFARRFGVFDPWTDVDVFVACLTKGKPRGSQRHWTPAATDNTPVVQDYFNLHIGPVVPHRHAEEGTAYRYIHPRTLPPWGTRIAIRQRRCFAGTVYHPPFVAVRRTSRPGDRRRAVPTIVLGKQPVAVENHLIVLVPRDGSVNTCHELVKRFALAKTDEWLDQRISCRHLTVSALGGLPWWNETNE